jgi:hypothetical protein
MDHIFGPGYRGTEVRAALAAQLLPLPSGIARLYEQIAGTSSDNLDRFMHFWLVLLVVALAMTLVAWSRQPGAPEPARWPRSATSAGALAFVLSLTMIQGPRRSCRARTRMTRSAHSLWSESTPFATALGSTNRGRGVAWSFSRTLTASLGLTTSGAHVLNPDFPLVQNVPSAPTPRRDTRVDPSVLDRYVGRYQFAPAVILTVGGQGNRLFTQFTGGPPFELFAESEKDCFLKAADAQFTFEYCCGSMAPRRGRRVSKVLPSCLGRSPSIPSSSSGT